MITDLRLQQFRSYKDASFDFGDGVNIIVGPNASGKTNLLEALLMVAQGASYRNKDGELIRYGQDWARLDADTVHGLRTVKLKRGPGGTVVKSFEIDSQVLSRLTQTRALPVVLFEPNHLLLLSGSPELRRDFLDGLLEQTVVGFGSVRRHYKRVLSHRNALLKKQPRDLREQLFVWDLRLSELGGRLARERQRLTVWLDDKLSGSYNDLSGSGQAVEIVYSTRLPVESYETALLRKLEDSLELDRLRGFTAHGPHRDDLMVSIDGRNVLEAASRGETRTLVLALKILELALVEELAEAPALLLLDDVFSELDGKRRQALTSLVADHQTFITTTDADLAVKHFAGGNVIPVERG